MASEVFPQSRSGPQRLIASPWHTLLVVVLAALNAYRGVILAANARAGIAPGRPYIYLRTILFEFLFLAIVILGLWLRGESLDTIFGQRWLSVGQVLRDLGLGVALLLASALLVSVLSGHQRGTPSNELISFLIPRTSVDMLLWMCVSVTAGICEEAIYRGYFQRQFIALTHSVSAGIVISAVLFGAEHAYQGVQRAFVIGAAAILSGMFVQWRGTVRPSMFAHMLQDAIAPTLIKLMRR